MNMIRKNALLSLLVLVLSFSVFSFSQQQPEKKETPVTALVGGTLIDGTGAAPVPDAVVLIQGDKIKAAGPAAQVKVPEGAERVDVKGKFVLPGFIDCHIHTFYPYDNMQAFTETNSLDTLRALHIMEMYAKTGVTSIRDVASPVEVMQALLRGQQLGYIDSIRLFACGTGITVTGGHGDGLKGVITADGPWEWRRAVRQLEKEGFRHIKILPTFTLEEAQAAVDEAKTLGLRITAHGGGLSDTTPTSMTKIAAQAGVHCIEHLNEMEDDALDLIAQKGVYLVPTMAVYRELYRAQGDPQEPRREATLVAVHARDSLQKGAGSENPYGDRDGRGRRVHEALSRALSLRAQVLRGAGREPHGDDRDGDEERRHHPGQTG